VQGGLLAAVPVRRDAEVQGNEGSCESDGDQQAAEPDPAASAAAQRDRQPAQPCNKQTYFRDSPCGDVVESCREHRGLDLLPTRPLPQA